VSRTTSSTFAPSRSRSAPSTTTIAPTATPLSIAVISPCVAPTFTGVTATVLSSLTT